MEVRQIKAMVEGFRIEARSSLPDDAFMAYWEKRNDELRNLGIKTVGLEQD